MLQGMSEREIINRMSRLLQQAYQPRRIVLFGSRARGNAHPGSDVDLLVVLDEVVNRRRTAVEMRVGWPNRRRERR
jgi:predicted nucleotidyltransferase